MSKPSGKVSGLIACQKACRAEAGCQSITYYEDAWCSLFSTACTRRRQGNRAIKSMRWGGRQLVCHIGQSSSNPEVALTHETTVHGIHPIPLPHYTRSIDGEYCDRRLHKYANTCELVQSVVPLWRGERQHTSVSIVAGCKKRCARNWKDWTQKCTWTSCGGCPECLGASLLHAVNMLVQGITSAPIYKSNL